MNPLYRRPSAAKERRQRIEDVLRKQPGLSFRHVCKATEIPTGTARHHLRILVKQKRIWYTPIGSRLAHFAGPKPASSEGIVRAVTATFDELDALLYRRARERGPLCQGELIDVAPEKPKSTVQHRLKRLVRQGFLHEVPQGRRLLYSVPVTNGRRGPDAKQAHLPGMEPAVPWGQRWRLAGPEVRLLRWETTASGATRWIAWHPDGHEIHCAPHELLPIMEQA